VFNRIFAKLAAKGGKPDQLGASKNPRLWSRDLIHCRDQ